MNTTVRSLSKRSLLLVDDDRLVVATLARYLQRAGYDTRTAESAEEAEALLASGERPDLAILDVRMPGRSGLELAQRLYALDHIPFMLLTASSEKAVVEQASACGALGFLVKPVDLPQIVPAVEAALARAVEIRDLRETRQQLQQALDAEREISVAVGITMMQYRLGRKAAFEVLRKSARSQCRKLADYANEVVRACDALHPAAAGRGP